MGFITKKTAIVGIAETKERRTPYKTALQIHAEMAKEALEDAGLTKDDVDGYFTCGIGWADPLLLAEYLQIKPTYMDSTSIGGASFVSHVGHAAGAIASGMCDVALITYGSVAWSQGVAVGTGADVDVYDEAWDFEVPYGFTIVGCYALLAQRHAHLYGTTDAQRAEVSVANRKWAALNPDAMFRFPITIENVVNSRIIASPLHFLECCVISDGGGAIVMTSSERARDLKHPPAYILGAGEAGSHLSMSQVPDFVSLPAKLSGEKAFKMAGVKPKEIDVVEIYDSFTITALLSLEDLGFCKKGEVGDFVSGQRTAPGGDFPMNTDGGGLSSNHPGMRGIFLVIEATRQLRGGLGERQVPNVKLALAHGTGGNHSSGATVILGRD